MDFMQEPVEVTLGGTDKVYCIPLEMLQKLLTNELVLEEVCLYVNPIICTEIKRNYPAELVYTCA